MAKKSKQFKGKKKVTAVSSQFDKWMDLIGHQIFQGDYGEAVTNCERLLNSLPMRASQRVDVLAQLGTAQGMLQNFPQSYEAFSEALALDPNDAGLWFNRSMASRFTIRFGRALRDVERAIELNTRSELVEQEDLFQQGLKLMEAWKWEEAGQAFQASIDLGDCLPQPWGNLGICLLMQERYDESEAALKRALVIDPTYTLAKDNLALLADTRRTGLPDTVAINQPFKGSKLKQSITYIGLLGPPTKWTTLNPCWE